MAFSTISPIPPIPPIQESPADSASQANVSVASGSQGTTIVPDIAGTPPCPPEREPKDGVAEPIFPLLSNSTETDTSPLVVGALGQPGTGQDDDDDDDEPAVAKPFVRTSSPDSSLRPRLAPGIGEDGDEEDHTRGFLNQEGEGRKRAVHKMHKYSLYETASRYYIVGGDVTEKRYRILKIDRTTDDSDLSITDDKILYSHKEMIQLLDTIDDGNKGTGGIKLRCTTWGLLGFIKFTGHYYMLLITKKSTVAMIGGHYIYQIDGTELIPLTPARFRPDQKNTEESRFLTILGNLDLTRSFYYSYSYDVTRTLQHNIIRERTAIRNGEPVALGADFNSMFVWNSHLLQPAEKVLSSPFDWCRSIIHGYVDQAAVSVYGRTAYVAVIARRSRHFAGARFLKRGANDLGYVANDVETEQIVSEVNTTSFHSPGPKLYASPQYTSYVQHRGSIPLHWSQDSTGVTPKPPIELNLVDPFYTSAALHFDNLFERYGAPIYALNLVKARERTPRESKLLEEYTKAIHYLNQFLPEGKKIIHRAWDMSRAAKSRDQDVIGILERIAEDVVTTTGYFHNGDGVTTQTRVQNGVARTNCIDCLDRTNAAQFVIGKRALGHQLHALGILEDTVVDYDTDAVNLLTHMYHDHGDTIAVQYGGSQLVNTMETYRKINQWTSHSRDMIESFKRYYNNSFLDGQRQEAYNLFLGNYIFARGQPMLWDLATDYYLHHADPRGWLGKPQRNYIRWFTPEYLKPREVPPHTPPKRCAAASPSSHAGTKIAAATGTTTTTTKKVVSFYDDYWLEYYRPSTLSSFLKMFPYKMNSTIKFIPFKSTQEGRYDLSPFRVRTEGDQDVQDKRRRAAKREVTILAPHDVARLADNDDSVFVLSGKSGANKNNNNNSKNNNSNNSSGNNINNGGRGAGSRGGLRGWLQPGSSGGGGGGNLQGIMKGPASSAAAMDIDSPLKLAFTAGGGGGGLLLGKPGTAQMDKTRAAQWTFAKVVQESLNPSVSQQEAEDYARYISHPQTLPLVVSSAESAGAATATATAGGVGAATTTTTVDEGVDLEYQEYVAGSWLTEGLSSISSNGGGGAAGGLAEEEIEMFHELLRVGENPLTVTEGDAQKKRYKAYRKWLRGKSLFKQQPVD